MTSQGLSLFMLRRVLCATLLFVALLIAVFSVTSVYYVVRINMIEKHLNAREGTAKQHNATALAPADAAGALYREEAVHGYQFMSRATPAGHSELAGRRRRSSTPPYQDAYKVLSVNAPLSRQAVRNPTLPESIPMWEDEVEAEERDGTARRVRVPARQRYVLLGVEAGRQYMLRLSYLGSPSVAFEMLLYQVPRSRLDALYRAAATSGRDGQANAGGWSTVPQDTELRVFSMSTTNALQFDYEEEVWLDERDGDDEDGEEEEEDGDTDGDTVAGGKVSDPALRAAAGRAAFEDKVSAHRYAPVVEICPLILSIPIDSARLPVVRFNIVLEPLSSSFLPQTAVPLIMYSASVVVFVGYLCLYTFVSSGIAGGRRHAD